MQSALWFLMKKGKDANNIAQLPIMDLDSNRFAYGAFVNSIPVTLRKKSTGRIIVKNFIMMISSLLGVNPIGYTLIVEIQRRQDENG